MPRVSFALSIKTPSPGNSDMKSGKRVSRSLNTRSTPTSPVDGTQIEVQLETLNIEQYNVQFHIGSIQGIDPIPRSPMSPTFLKKYNEPQRLVHVFYEGEGYSGHVQTDPATESYSIWSENLTQLGPVVPSDKFTFRVERRSPIQGLRPHRQNFFASTKEYTLETLLTLQGKQGVGKVSEIPSCFRAPKDVRLPLLSSTGSEISEAFLVVQVRQLTAPFIAQRLQKEALANTTLKPEDFLCSPVFQNLT